MIGKAFACGLLFLSCYLAAVQQPDQVAQLNDVHITNYPAAAVAQLSTTAPTARPARFTGRRYIYAHCPDWHTTYAHNLLTSGQVIGTDYMFPTSIVRLADGRETVDMTLRACAEARALGYRAMPGVVHGLSASFGHCDTRAWIDRETWARYAKVTILAATACDETRRMVVDLEPYWEGQRYLPNTALNRAMLREAMLPWLNVLKKLEIKLFVLPGYHEEYAFCPVLAQEGVVEMWCGEGTYNDPCSDNVLAWIRTRDQQARAATGAGYLSGHYARKLQTRANEAWFSQLGDHWVYLSGWPEDDKWNFGKATWFRVAEPEEVDGLQR